MIGAHVVISVVLLAVARISYAAAAVYLSAVIWYPVHAAQPFVHLTIVLPAAARKKREIIQ